MPLIRCRYVLCLFSYVYLGTGFRPYISIPLNCALRQLQFCLLDCSAFVGPTAGCVARACERQASFQIKGNKIQNIYLLPSLRASIPTRSWAYTEPHCKHQTFRHCLFSFDAALLLTHPHKATLPFPTACNTHILLDATAHLETGIVHFYLSPFQPTALLFQISSNKSL